MARPASDIGPRIVHAARARFLQEGVDGAALRQIARDAGTNIGMVYYYFKTKDDLFFAVVEDVYRVILADVTQLMTTDLPEQERLQQLYQRLARISDEEFQVLSLILREALISSARFTRLGELFLRGHIPVVVRCFLDGVAKGQFRSDLSPLIALGATLSLGIMPQIVRRLVSATALPGLEALPAPTEVAHAMSDVLVHGIGAGPAR
jgi:TetR/AcrR family transcriptional regulator, cholesterol catabolism regulator